MNYFNEWWLLGSTHTAHWSPGGQVLVGDPDNMDITNHYIKEGLGGGLLKLGLFIAIIVVGYKTVGRRIKIPTTTVPQRLLLWSISIGLTRIACLLSR